MECIAADGEALHVGVADLDAFLVDPGVECGLDLEAGLGRCRGNQLNDGSTIGERPTTPVLRDAAEQPMFDLVPLCAAET